MAKVKNLKKEIKDLTGELIGECFAYGYFHEDANMEKVSQTLKNITAAHNSLMDKINNGIYDKKLAKAHFSEIVAEARKMPELLVFE